MMTTAGMMRAMPVQIFHVRLSLRNRQPSATAVSGSSAPSTAVIVEPMRFTAATRQRLVTTVQTRPSVSRLVACSEVVTGWKSF